VPLDQPKIDDAFSSLDIILLFFTLSINLIINMIFSLFVLLLASVLVRSSPTPAGQVSFELLHLPGHHVYPLPGDKLPTNVSLLLPQEVRAWTAPAYYAS
jgi:hypothetical protein